MTLVLGHRGLPQDGARQPRARARARARDARKRPPTGKGSSQPVRQVSWVAAYLTKESSILSTLLCIISSLAPSNAGAERNWSTHDFIVSTRRNRPTDARERKVGDGNDA